MNADGNADRCGNAGHPQFDKAELQSLFNTLAKYPRAALAVSGGADSTALMQLVRRWLDLSSLDMPTITVLTVDHALRQESSAEAKWVAEQAAKLHFSHKTLVWSGDKPKTGLQEAARIARYDLLAAYCREHLIPAIVTAHTSDDQAETIMMRLARGSGLDGLSGMEPVSQWDNVDLLRPLLAKSRADLEAFLRDQGQAWLEDPTNRDETYERVRVRKALEAVNKLGISQRTLTLSARRLARARNALEIVVANFLKSNLTVHEAGFGEMPFEALFDAPEEVALRALSRMTAAFGGRKRPPQLSKIEGAYLRLKARPRTLTLGGCRFSLRKDRMLILREYGRLDRAGTPFSSGQTVIWDRRFTVTSSAGDVTLRPLGAVGVTALKEAGGDFGSTPRAVAMTLPSMWRCNTLCYVPFATFQSTVPDGWANDATAEFVNAPILFAHRHGHRK